ncbi:MULTISPECIES: N-acetyltransferase [Ornithinibacillus]|uniref:N-acetyltransferase n=1 Tax=Ornithinibacillus TaxID=484508 RepID=UPI001C9AD199|nr:MULTISPECIES: N-acetyltransferase [Ornithinibacillus]
MQISKDNTINIRLAIPTDTSEVLTFFEENIEISHDHIYNREFVCPDGVKAAIRRKQMLIAKKEYGIVGALRFYKKKTDGSISLYQFAICKNHRKQGLLKQMLSNINTGPVRVKCPKHSSMNHYFDKTGWILHDAIGELNCWQL